jgi:YbgC/YbaW family acyl-CoA thioester hydrolase
MTGEYRFRRRVEFAETDMAGIVHFSNFFRYMEMAEHDFLRSIGLSVHADLDGRTVSWPRVRAECSYHAPATFEDELEIVVTVREKRTKTLTYDFRFFKGDAELIASGTMTVVCVAIDPATRKMTSIPIPECIGRKIETTSTNTILH